MSPEESNKQAAAKIMRSQIDNLYESSAKSRLSQQQIENPNPYQRTHGEQTGISTDDWQKYHSAWQDYYQKYYESYYTHHLNKAQLALNADAAKSTNGNERGFFSHQPLAGTEPSETPSTEETMFDLRQRLVGKVQESTTKFTKSRHFIPLIAGIITILIFLFLQYNRFIISNVMAYVSPGNIDPQNIVIDPNTVVAVGPEPRLIIPKINVDVPVLYDVGSDFDSQMAAMSKGVAHFAVPGASSHPGQIGNTVIAGHSSNDLLDSGDYKFIFAQLDKLVVGDTIYANYGSKRYTYTVTNKEVVQPNQVDKLTYATTKPILTLITCTPVGTAISRLIITSEQISPDPSLSIDAPVSETTDDTTIVSIPGNSPTLIERIFGLNN